LNSLDSVSAFWYECLTTETNVWSSVTNLKGKNSIAKGWHDSVSGPELYDTYQLYHRESRKKDVQLVSGMTEFYDQFRSLLPAEYSPRSLAAPPARQTPYYFMARSDGHIKILLDHFFTLEPAIKRYHEKSSDNSKDPKKQRLEETTDLCFGPNGEYNFLPEKFFGYPLRQKRGPPDQEELTEENSASLKVQNVYDFISLLKQFDPTAKAELEKEAAKPLPCEHNGYDLDKGICNDCGKAVPELGSAIRPSRELTLEEDLEEILMRPIASSRPTTNSISNANANTFASPPIPNFDDFGLDDLLSPFESDYVPPNFNGDQNNYNNCSCNDDDSFFSVGCPVHRS
jgi:hypothetical protein